MSYKYINMVSAELANMLSCSKAHQVLILVIFMYLANRWIIYKLRCQDYPTKPLETVIPNAGIYQSVYSMEKVISPNTTSLEHTTIIQTPWYAIEEIIKRTTDCTEYFKIFRTVGGALNNLFCDIPRCLFDRCML